MKCDKSVLEKRQVRKSVFCIDFQEKMIDLRHICI